jgi:hypothetical protein
MFIYSWNAHSEGATALKDAIPALKKIKHENSRFRGSPKKVVINWGSSTLPEEVLKSKVLNHPSLVVLCSNKLNFFRKVTENNPELLPPWTEDFNEAISWVRDGNLVCARTILNGHSANGLVIMKPDDPTTFVRAPLYTQYIKKNEEYRVHIVKGEVIDIQRKVLSRAKAEAHAETGEEINWQVRNHDNGFIYQRDNIDPNPDVERAAIEAMSIIGLDFGAVDVIYNRHHNRAYVLEINTAPGLTGTTVINYAEALKDIR